MTESGAADDDEHVSLQEAADLLGVHYMTAYRYVRSGRLIAGRVGSPGSCRARTSLRP